MIVIADRIKNAEHSVLHWDFINETCRSFGAILVTKEEHTQSHLKNTIVSLQKDNGAYLEDIDITNTGTVLVGCDDSNYEQDNWMNIGVAVRIRTPVDYYLWSGVALGIFLYQLHISSLK